ncbi:MAG: alpha/beta hydrolase [Pseudomonadota bacterium]
MQRQVSAPARLRSPILAALAALSLAGCTVIGVPGAGDKVKGPPASPDIMTADYPAIANASPTGAAPLPLATNADEWRDVNLAMLREAFETHVYGAIPGEMAVEVADRRVLDTGAFGGTGLLEELSLRIDTPDGGSVPLRVALVRPAPEEAGAAAPRRRPLILAANFCGNKATMGRDDVSPPQSWYPTSICERSWTSPIATFIFGRHIQTPPIEKILARGYALATFYPGEIAPDEPELAKQALDRLTTPGRPKPGTVAVWAWGFSRALDALADEPWLDDEAISVYGHSRHGKAALLAGVFDTRIDAIIAHQSGTGGATLSRSYAGESVGKITESYPHWFTEAYAGYADQEDALPIDQHMLIALAAPRPMLLGNAYRDVWSDPQGAFRAAQGADPVYEAAGVRGLAQDRLKDVDLSAEIAFYMRGGRHGVTTLDWRMFLDFLDIHLVKAPSGLQTAGPVR